jgi:hypothetical protein
MKMKNIIFILVIIISFAISKKLRLKQDVEPSCIRIYPECDFRGEAVDLCGKQSISHLELFFNGQMIKSFRLGYNSRAYFYEGELNGSNRSFEESESCLDDNKYVSLSVGFMRNWEFDVPVYCARLWEECEFEGDYIDVCGDLDLKKDTNYANFAKSIQL